MKELLYLSCLIILIAGCQTDISRRLGRPDIPQTIADSGDCIDGEGEIVPCVNKICLDPTDVILGSDYVEYLEFKLWKCWKYPRRKCEI